MARSTKVLSFSLPPETADKIKNIARTRHRSNSELLREMVDIYEEHLVESEWENLFAFGAKTAKRFKIKTEDELFEVLNEI